MPTSTTKLSVTSPTASRCRPRALLETDGSKRTATSSSSAGLVPEKGCHTLIEAFRGVETNKKLVIAGAHSHSEGYAESLKRLAAGDPRIVFAGEVHGEEKDSIYRNAYLFVLPSSIEGMALVLLEAMSYGRCCLCSNIPENMEVIRQAERDANGTRSDGSAHEHGFSFAVGNVADLKNRLSALLNDSVGVQAAGARAFDLVSTKFDWQTIADQHLALYGELANPSRG